jgi:hypothetical protein
MRGRHHARLFNALSFEAAAIAYVESAEFEAEAEDPIKLVVRDLGGGEEHCFTIDLASGESAECAPN